MAQINNEVTEEVGGDLDTRLLNTNKEDDDNGSSDRVAALRQAKREAANPKDNYLEEEPTSLRQAVIQGKKRKEAQIKKEKVVMVSKSTPMRQKTSALLRVSWLNLIDSFGLTLIWINIHVFLGMVIGNNFFCKLGEEWTDRPGLNSKVASNGAAGQAKKSVGTLERIGFGCLNSGCLLLIIAVLAVLAVVVDIISSPWKFFTEMMGLAWESIKETISNFIFGS